MPRITLDPGLGEFLSFREQYDGLVADLERAGYEVTLVDPVEKSQIPGAVGHFLSGRAVSGGPVYPRFGGSRRR
jgi:hypothetical protein